MPSITVDCYSLNFTNELHEFRHAITGDKVRGPKLLPITAAQRGAALKVIQSHEHVVHEDTRQIYIELADGGRIYVDSDLIDEPELLHFRIALRPEATQGIAQFVFDFAAGSEMALVLEELPLAMAVAATPISSIPADWPSARVCETTTDVQALLTQAFTTWTRRRERLRKLWHPDADS